MWCQLISWTAAKKKVEEVKKIGLPSSLFSLWFSNTTFSYCLWSISLSDLCPGLRKSLSGDKDKTADYRQEPRWHHTVAIWWGNIFPTTIMSPVGPRHLQVCQNNADSTNVSACVCVCRYLCVLISPVGADRPAEAVADFVWILSV